MVVRYALAYGVPTATTFRGMAYRIRVQRAPCVWPPTRGRVPTLGD
jgi:hypothetical protein